MKSADDEPPPVLDEEWVRAAPVTESRVRRHLTPPVGQKQPWRTWPPPERPTDGADSGRAVSRFSSPSVILILVSLVALSVLVMRLGTASRDPSRPTDGAAVPATPVPATPVPATTVPAATVSATPSGAPPGDAVSTQVVGMPAVPPTVSRPALAAPPRALPWTIASSLPPGPDVSTAEVFAQLAVGSCLAYTDPGAFHVVPCSGPHTDEITLSEDLTTRFPTTPTIDQITALSDQLCPPAGRTWTGGDTPEYTTGYLWQFNDGIPGQVLRRFLCTTELSGHSPFTGTLKDAARR